MTVPIDRSVRMPESRYVAEPQTKTGIALHDGECIEALGAVEPARNDTARLGAPLRIATAYVIDRDGTVHELCEATPARSVRPRASADRQTVFTPFHSH